MANEPGAQRIAQKSDWKTCEMPISRDTFVLDRTFTEQQMNVLRCGSIPQEMEDKWFWYMDGDTLYAHRSWTGYCIYIIEFKADGHHTVTVNRDPEQYKCTSVEQDIESLNKLLNYWSYSPYDHYHQWISETMDNINRAEKQTESMTESRTKEETMEDSSQAGQITLNNKFVLKYPDGFHVMSEEERSKLALLGEGQWVGLSDPERHMIVCAGWREVSKYALMLLGGKDLSRNMEKQIRKAMMPYGYKLGGLKELQIAGTQANGFSYEYTVQDVAMYAESYVLKSKNTVYYFHLYARAALRDESLPVWEEMLESVGTV